MVSKHYPGRNPVRRPGVALFLPSPVQPPTAATRRAVAPRSAAMLTLFVVILLILLLSGAAYGWQRNYYWGPDARPGWGIGGLLMLVLFVLLILWLLGVLGAGAPLWHRPL